MSDDAERDSPPTSSQEARPEPAGPDSASPNSASPNSASPDPASPERAAAGAAKAASAPPTARPSYAFLVIVTIANLGADLWTKFWAKDHFDAAKPGDHRLVVIEDHVNFIFAKNKGGAWGLLQNETEALRRPFFLIVSVAAIVFIVSLYKKLQPNQTALKWGLPLVLGGALGNLVDRIRYGYVVDFIDVYMNMDGKVKHWPTFNVADIAICIGVGLMAIDMFTSREKKGAAAARTPEPKTTPKLDDGAPESQDSPEAEHAPEAKDSPEAQDSPEVEQASEGAGAEGAGAEGAGAEGAGPDSARAESAGKAAVDERPKTQASATPAEGA